MKHKKILDNIFERFFQIAKDNLKKDSYLSPLVFLLRGPYEQPESDIVVEMRFKTEEDKNLLARRIENLIQSSGAWGYVLLNEAWLLASDDFPGQKLPTEAPPSQHAKRREAVWVALFTYDYHIGKAAIFERRTKQIVFTQEITMQPEHQFAGRFATMLPPMN